MGRLLSHDEWAAQLAGFEASAFRLELQPAYDEPGDSVARYLAGDPQDPDDVPEFRAWAAQVRAITDSGRTISRVRVHDDPPNGYQRWERWAGRQTIAAGERIRYLSRSAALAVGLLPAAGPDDWWLLDEARLVVMRFGGDRLVVSELVDDPERVAQACAWRDLAVRHSTPDTAGAFTP